MEPKQILDLREKRLRHRTIKDILVQWKGYPIEDALLGRLGSSRFAISPSKVNNLFGFSFFLDFQILVSRNTDVILFLSNIVTTFIDSSVRGKNQPLLVLKEILQEGSTPSYVVKNC